MIFLSEEHRSNCGRTDGGQFASNNKCAAGDDAPAAPPRDDSWKQASGKAEWDSTSLKQASPITGGEKLSRLTVSHVPSLRQAQTQHGLNLDEIVTLGGGAVRGADVYVSSYRDGGISVASHIPIDPDRPRGGSIETSIEIDKDEDTGSSFIVYATLFPTPSTDISADRAAQAKVASIMSERMLTSMKMAYDAGFSHAEMMAAGSKDDPDKGYRLWPQFGFDARLPQSVVASIPKSILDSTKRVTAGSKLSRKTLTVQELISTREGERWWDENGTDIDLSLQFSDTGSLGFKRFQEKLKKLDRLKGRNQNRSEDTQGLAESRNDCGRQEKGQFGPGNNCASDDSATATAAPKFESWMDSDKTTLDLTSNDLQESSLGGVTDGSKLGRVNIVNPKALATMSRSTGLSLGDMTTIAGGARAGGKIWFTPSRSGEQVRVKSILPLDPSDPKSLDIELDVDISKVGTSYTQPGKSVYYGEFYILAKPKENGARPKAEINDTVKSRLTSLLMQRMTDSMATAEEAGFAYAETYAAGSPTTELKGYRLWPQFGFDGKIPGSKIEALKEHVKSGKVKLTPEQQAAAASGVMMLQELIATRDGERWWNENGKGINLTFNFRDKNSLGYKRFEKTKARLKALKDRNASRGWSADDAEFRDDCGRQEGGRFGRGNDCASDDGGGSSAATASPASSKPDESWWESEGEARWSEAKLRESPPVTGGEVLSSFIVRDVEKLASSMVDIGGFKTFDQVVAVGGGVRKGGKVIVAGEYDSIVVNSIMPISPDGGDSDGKIEVNVTMFDGGDGLAVSYDEMHVDSPEEGRVTPESVRRVSSILLERMTESLATAEAVGAKVAETMAAGGSTSPLKGYRLWPQFGFDGELGRVHTFGLREFAQEAVDNRGEDNYDNPPGWAIDILDKLDSDEPLMLQELISSREGEKWWDENGKNIPLTFSFENKSSLGYKRFEKMKARLSRLKERNKNRHWIDDDAEFRGDCTDSDRQEGGKFGPGNDCGGDGNSSAPAAKQSSAKKAAKKEDASEPLAWSPGQDHVDVFAESVSSGATKRSEDGLKILSTSIEGAVVTKAMRGKEEVDPISVGRHLLAIQGKHRGRVINTKKELAGDDFEYMVSGVAAQVESAMRRGVAPNFYSPEDRIAQLQEYAKIQPLMRGGRTASGFCIGVEGPNGECEPTEGISPQAEFLFRAAQALTSPEANPLENMLRADLVLSTFFEQPDPEKAKLGLGVKLAGAGGEEAKKNFARLQKIIDRIGLDETAKLFASEPIRKGDFEKFFLDRLPGTEGDRYEPNDYAVDEKVPLFSIFGPKVGPFFSNNTGDTDSLTADIWFTRTWGRLSGELIEKSSPDLAKTHATKLMSSTKNIERSELAAIGLDGRQFRTIVADMKKSGVIPQAVVSWAEKRTKQYAKDGFPSPSKGTGTQERYELDRLATAILKNQNRVLRAPTTSVMRSNMIRVMQEASKRTGVPVAYMQDILWQDEQDAWGTLGSRTTTNPGEPSLYSDVIRKIVEDPSYRERRRASQRSAVDAVAEPAEYEYLTDEKGGFSQVMFAEFLSNIDDDTFADIAVEFLKRNLKQESRSADCGRDEGGRFGSGNKCQVESVYHGTDSGDPASIDFKETTQSQNSLGLLGNVDVTRHGIFFSDSKEFSAEYGKNVGQFDLDVKSVADLSPTPGGWHSSIVEEFLGSLDATGPDRDVWLTAKHSSPNKPWLMFDGEVGKKFTSWLKSNGYDSAEFKEESPGGRVATTFVVFDKKKIRPKQQSRSADCGREDDGRFGSGNKCQEDGDGTTDSQDKPSGPSKPVGQATYDELARAQDLKRVQRNIDAGDHATASRNISLMMEKSTPSEVASSLGFKSFDLDGTFDADTKKDRGAFFSFFGKRAVESASRHIASLAVASKIIPELKSSSFDFSTQKTFIQKTLDSFGLKTASQRLRMRTLLRGVMAACDLTNGNITVVQNAGSRDTLDKAFKNGYFSTNDPSHYVVHEYGHKLQTDGYREHLKRALEEKIAGREKIAKSDEFADYTDGSKKVVLDAIESEKAKLKELESRPLTMDEVRELQKNADQQIDKWSFRDSRMLSKASSVSKYGMTNGLELATEYWTAVTLGFRDNDEDLDKYCESIFMPRPRKKAP